MAIYLYGLNDSSLQNVNTCLLPKTVPRVLNPYRFSKMTELQILPNRISFKKLRNFHILRVVKWQLVVCG